jgi:hypothetical protein
MAIGAPLADGARHGLSVLLGTTSASQGKKRKRKKEKY